MRSDPRFLTDEMLSGLARWLRAAGHDTAHAPARAADGALVALAAAENRLLLTRDRAILERKAAAGLVLVLDGEGMEAWAAELSARLALDWCAAPFSRCLVCNAALVAAPEAIGLPPGAHPPVRWCPACRKPYWRGSHVRRMEARLRRWAGGSSP
ncbi:MAG: DUF5615 family PIN-like protein [Pseudomonadota bacterium]